MDKHLIFDLDGVLRDLAGYLNAKFNIPYPQEWFWKYQGKDIYQWIKEDNYYTLIYAPITKYFFTIMELVNELEIWSYQPEDWRRHTEQWLKHNITKPYRIEYLATEEKRKKLDQRPDCFLIEDSPNFSSYERIILINEPYNKEIKDVIRIYNPEQLREWIIENLKKETYAKI